MLRLEVRDTGIGIAADRIKYIFDRYYQVGKSENNELQGMGIGLSQVREFVDLLNGKIEVQSNEGNGSTFKVALPLVLPGQKHYYGQDKISDGSGDSDLPDLKIEKRPDRLLLVEDNHDLRYYLKDLLSRQYQVMDVSNGMEALACLKKHNHIDLIVSDWIMPGMDGIKFCHTLSGSDIPKPRTDDPNNNFGTISDWYLENGSYLRVKNLSTWSLRLDKSRSNRLVYKNIKILYSRK